MHTIAHTCEGARSQAKGVVVHSERVHVFAKKGVATAECFSSYMPSVADVSLVSLYQPKALRLYHTLCFSTLGMGVPAWRLGVDGD